MYSINKISLKDTAEKMLSLVKIFESINKPIPRGCLRKSQIFQNKNVLPVTKNMITGLIVNNMLLWAIHLTIKMYERSFILFNILLKSKLRDVLTIV